MACLRFSKQIYGLTLLFLGIVSGEAQTIRLYSDWQPYEKGFTSANHEGKSGGVAFVCENKSAQEVRGASYTYHVNQKETYPFLVSAWSKAKDVGGSSDDGYSLYIDLLFMDGGHLWGTVAPFSGGSHGWEERQLRILPSKPVKDAVIYVLFRKHQGTVWFSDISMSVDKVGNTFDFQSVKGKLPTHAGWYVRDVTANGPLVGLEQLQSIGMTARETTTSDRFGIHLSNKTLKDRAVTIYYCKPIDVVGGRWWNTIRSTQPISRRECANLSSVSSGAVRMSSRYPFAAVAKGSSGQMIAIPPSMGPRVARLFYNPSAKLLCAAYDVALTRVNRIHPGTASASVILRSIQPEWGMRDAARQYYATYPGAFQNRMSKQGIWIPFSDPQIIPHLEDFGIAVHEGDNSVASDNKLGIYSFRYTEPMTWWMNMAPSVPRTYQAAIDELHKALKSPEITTRRQAEAVMTSGTFGSDQRFNVYFENQPWANGAVWILNPNPRIEVSKGMARQADVLFDVPSAEKRYKTTSLSGEYLDSLEAHSEVVDYRPETLAASTLEPCFDPFTKQPVIPQAYSTYEIAQFMSQRLHLLGRLLMANTTPASYFGYMPLLDCAGIEVNWLDNGAWSPDDDDVFCYRRTLSYHKPYMLLQNTDFSHFGSPEVAKYFDRCLFYGVFPSFFSADAATHVYWENSKLIERDRPMFKKIIPLVKLIAEAGWEPITLAHTSDSEVFIERFGTRYWTVFNNSNLPKAFEVTFDRSDRPKEMVELKSGVTMSATGSAFKLSLEPGECKVIRM